MVRKNLFVFLIFALGCFRLVRFTAPAKVPQEEADNLEEILSVLGVRHWKFNADTCQVEMVGVTLEPPKNSKHEIACECHYENNSVCHVVRIMLKRYNLPGTLPPQLTKLPYLQEIDLAYNFLSGNIPREWASTNLTNITLLVNRLTGEIPKELGNISALIYLNLEANLFSGVVPLELGNLINLQNLILSSNLLTGNLPATLSRLTNLTDFRINDNNFTGTIPNFMQNWKQLDRLEMHASGLDGPIPSTISTLKNMVILRISDINGPDQPFPLLKNMNALRFLVLRNCNILAEIPPYIWTMKDMEMLDLSFNKMVGKVPPNDGAERLKFLFLSGNMLSGDIPESILKEGTAVDLSYNNFTFQDPEHLACRKNINLNLNLFRSSSMKNNLRGSLPCMKEFHCPRLSNCLHVNCGGNDISIKENGEKILYEGDEDVGGGSARYYLKDSQYWGFSSTGDFMDDFGYQDLRYTISAATSSNISSLYATARITPITLTYFHYCLVNGMYTVKLNFAEIQFTNDKTYNSLGRRSFDIYVQEKLVQKGFDIESGLMGAAAEKPVIVKVNVNVTSNYLEVRFHWAGKGTTRIPRRGVYGPLVSALSVVSDFKPCPKTGKSVTAAYIAVGVGAPCLVLIILGILWWKGYLPGLCRERKGGRGDDLPRGNFTLKQIEAATNEFDSNNKIGEGGFGPVYKGLLSDGRLIAVKQLSSHSRQGNREFLNEIGIISCLQHPNLVKLHGSCVQGDQLLLVYEYLENNNLARALFSPEKSHLKLDWPTRYRICLGIARGLAFLHEESTLKIVHRDIKATNVLLDADLNPKISDFGLAKLNEGEKTHISTRIAGTIGYMAPEYALFGHLTFKADVYSFGVLVLEVVSGKSNTSFQPSEDFVCLIDWASQLHQSGDLVKLVDEKLRHGVQQEETTVMIKIGLLCTNATASLRPTMSEVVNMLEGQIPIPDNIPDPTSYVEDLRFKAVREFRQGQHNFSGTQTQSSTTIPTFDTITLSVQNYSEINPEPKAA